MEIILILISLYIISIIRDGKRLNSQLSNYYFLLAEYEIITERICMPWGAHRSVKKTPQQLLRHPYS